MDKFIISEELKLSSVEIAALTGKRHDNVSADIKNMLEQLDISPLCFQGTYLDAQGKSRPCFSLPKKEVMVLLTGYSIPLRAKVIDRLEELEKRNIPTKVEPLTLLRITLEAMEKAEKDHLLLKENHEKLEEKVDTAIDDSILSSIEQGQLNAAIDNKAKIYGQVKFNGYIKRDLKNRYFGVSAGKQRTFKEIPRKHFKDAIEFVQRWIPSPTY